MVHCNLVNNNYQQTSEVLFTFVPNKQFGQLINIPPHSLTIPLKKSWNFKAVFQKTSTDNPEVNISNHSGILMEFYWNTIGILPAIFSKFTACFPKLFQWNTTDFLAERSDILMEFSWYFDKIFVVFSRIWVVFWYNFSGSLMEFHSKKQCKGFYLQNLTDIFVEFFIYFFILLYPKRAWKNPCTAGT